MLTGPNIARGLNQRGLSVTMDLNPEQKAVVATGLLQEVKVEGLDGATVTFPPDVQVFRDDVSTFHKDDGVLEDIQHTATGLDPQADPPRLFQPDESLAAKDDGALEGAQHTNTGLGPQVDPPGVLKIKASMFAKRVGGRAAPQHTVTGLEPQQLPQEHRLDESTYHKDDGAQEGPQHTASGLEPQADPAPAHQPKESGSEEDCDDE